MFPPRARASRARSRATSASSLARAPAGSRRRARPSLTPASWKADHLLDRDLAEVAAEASAKRRASLCVRRGSTATVSRRSSAGAERVVGERGDERQVDPARGRARRRPSRSCHHSTAARPPSRPKDDRRRRRESCFQQTISPATGSSSSPDMGSRRRRRRRRRRPGAPPRTPERGRVPRPRVEHDGMAVEGGAFVLADEVAEREDAVDPRARVEHFLRPRPCRRGTRGRDVQEQLGAGGGIRSGPGCQTSSQTVRPTRRPASGRTTASVPGSKCSPPSLKTP